MQVKPLNNFVLLKVKSNNSNIRLEGGQIIYLDTSYQKEKHSNVVCQVVQVPDRLVYGLSSEEDKYGRLMPKENSMDWKTEQELIVGDEVIIHYMGYVNAFGDDKRAFTLDGEEYFFCPYDFIYLAKRRWTKTEEESFWKIYDRSPTKYITEQWKQQHNIVFGGKGHEKEIYNVIMLNGYILVQPIEKALESKLIELPESLLKTNKKKVKVCFVGSMNKEYINGIYHDAKVEAGDIIVIDKNCDVPLEAHETFNGTEEYWRLQTCLVHAIIREPKSQEA
jgi:co-chaperonin GroES (HSP10)